MKKSHVEGLAIHNGLESCGAARKSGAEAWTEERAGRVLSRERQLLRDADAVGDGGMQRSVCRYREAHRNPARSETPCTHRSTMRGNREVPGLPGKDVDPGRVGKSKDVRR